MAWLIDTNILTELRRPRPHAKVVEFLAAKPLEDLYISVVTIAEIRFGIDISPDAHQREVLNDWLTTTVRPMFAGRVFSIHEELLVKWRMLIEDGRRRGHTFSQPDSLIAATAAHYNLTVVSRDRRPFEVAGLPLVDPWN